MRRLITAAPVLFQYLLLTTLFSPSIGGDTLTTNQPYLIDNGGKLVSAGGSFALGFFRPAGSTNRYVGIWYHKITVPTVVWVANRQQPLAYNHSGTLTLLPNGTLVITDENSTTVWSSSTPLAVQNPVAQLLDNGNFIVGEAGMNTSDSDSFAWQSFDFPTDTLLPGMKLGWTLTTKFNRQLSSWKSEIDPASGQYTFGIDLHGDPQIYEWSGTSQVWRAGPWNGLRFTGVPQMQTYRSMFSLQFFISNQEVVYTFHMVDPQFVSRLMVNSSGTLHRMVWVEQNKYWNTWWTAPMDQCDVISPCGTNGFPMLCSCLQGFHPNNPENWALRVGTDGCARKTALDCRNGTDGFVLVSGVKLPDTSSAAVDWSMSMEECRRECLKNCSCTAYAQANISGSGSGCIAWYSNLTDLRVYGSGGQDLYVRLAAADLGTDSHHGHAAVIIVAIALATFFLAAVAYFVWKRRKRKLQSIPSDISFREDNIDAENDSTNLDLPLFDLATIIDATDNFSIENKLGEGGFGPVYKGKLAGAEEIAVKRLSKNSIQGLDEFKNEITLIAKLQHRNLVRLLGCCIQGEERILIYEYLPNSSLDSFLFEEAKRVLLNWNARSNIIIGIARGLLYLHQDSRFRIIHRDLKASNILLDLDMNPKISDFGMARIFGADETEITKRVVGTYGYMSPEYAMDGIFSVKSDVFSFGVLILEIISGKKNRGVYHSTQNMNLLGYAWILWIDGKGLELVDELMSSSFPKAEVLRFIKIGLLCVQERPEDRPTISSILLMLGGDNAMVPHPRQPGFVSIRGPCESDSSKNDSLSINNVSITMFDGR